MSVNQVSNTTKSVESAVARGDAIKSSQSSAADLFGGMLQRTVDTISDYATGGVSTGGDFAELIRWQVAIQEEMQSTNMVSNIEKSRHETKMAPIRNIRVG